MNIDLKTLLKSNVDFFVKYMNELNHLNLRTFQFFLSKIENLYEIISGIKNQARAAFFNYILQYCFKICVNYKADTLLYLWERKQEYGNVKLLGKCVAIDDLYHPGEDKDINQQTKEILNELNQFIQESFKENVKGTIGEIIIGNDGWASRWENGILCVS